MRRAAVLGALLVLVLGAVFVVRPFVAAQRVQPAEIVSPASLSQTDVVPLAPGRPVCFGNAVIEQHSEIAEFKVGGGQPTIPPLDVHIAGGVYNYVAKVPAQPVSEAVISTPVPAAPTDIPVVVCIYNRGTKPVALFASNDRTRSRSIATVGNKSTASDGLPGKSVWFAFYEAAPHAITERVPATLERMTVFRPHYVTRGLLWVLAALLLVGMPIGIVWAYQRALRDDERAAPREVDVARRRSLWQRFVD